MRTRKRLLSLLLCGAMLFSVCSPSAYAEAQTIQDSGQITVNADGLCEHHTEHDEDCGYSDGEPGTLCAHEHSEDCYTEITECVHKHTADCYPVGSVSDNIATPSNAEEREPENCAHVCSEDSGCITEKLDCQHERDSGCGYSPAAEGTPCGYVCKICNPADSGELEETEQTEAESEDTACICTVLCTEDSVNGDCPVCGAEDADLTQCAGKEIHERVKAVQAMIDALPATEELSGMSREEQNEVYDVLQAAHDAYEALTEEQQEEITGTEIFDSLLAFFNGLIDLLEAEVVSIADRPVLIDDAGGPDCSGHIITGTSATNTITVTNGTHNITLQGVDINVSGQDDKAAFSISSGATVHLTLSGENTLKSGDNCAGLQVPDGAELVITDKSSGSLEAAGGYGGAGIGGGYRGGYGGDGGEITIKGGTVNATGKYGAGIGGGGGEKGDGGGYGGTITISGGDVTATSEFDGAGIGGGGSDGGSGSNITITGGKVTASSNGYGAGIGGGRGGAGGIITISGGTVKATGNGGAGIGGGFGCYGGEITISGGTVDVTSTYGAGIGGGSKDPYAQGTEASAAGGEITINGGTVTATSEYTGAGIGGGEGGAGGMIIISGGTVKATGIGGGEGGADGTFTADGNAFIVADSISDQSGKKSNWKGVIFEGDAGWVYNSPVKLTTDAEVPSGKVLTIQDGQTLTIGNGVTLKNAGTITNNGTINVEPGGRLEGEVGGKPVNWPSDEIGVMAVSVDGTPGSIDGATITVILPYGADPTRINITLADKNATFSPPATEDGGATWTFTVTAEDRTTTANYTINVSIAPDPAAGNKADVAAAKSTIEAQSWTVGQSTANTEAAVKTWIEDQLAAMNLNSVSCSVTIMGFTAATAGSSANKAGTNGSFTVTVALSKGAGDAHASDTVTGISGTITATPYQAQSYQVSVSASPAEGGTVSASPTSAEQGEKINLTASANSGYQFKKWQVVSGNVRISGNSFTMPAGNVTVKAIFEKDSAPTPPQPTEYTVTFDGNGGTSPAAQTTKDGKLTSLPVSTQSGYSFNGWYTAKTGGEKVTLDTVFTASVTVYAQWTKNSGGNSGGNGSSGGGSGGSTIVERPDETKPEIPATGQTKPVKPDENGNVAVDNGAVQSAINAAKNDAKKNGNTANGVAVVIPITPKAGQTSFNVTIKAQTLNLLVREKVKRLEINIDGVIVEALDARLLAFLNTPSTNRDIVFRVKRADPSGLSQEAKAAVVTRPAYDLSLVYLSGRKETPITDLGGCTISIRLPYTPAKEEQTGNLYAVYVDSKGKVEWLTKSSYDPDLGGVVFEIGHFSIYGIGYKNPVPAFTDIKGHWAEDNIIFVVSRGLLAGTGNNQFSPNTGMTRGMFVTALGRLAGIDPANYKTGKFTDVKADAYYAPYVNWAAEKGIVNGTTATTFSPDTNITREQMAVIMAGYAKKLGYELPVVHDAVTFADNAQISGWAAKEVKAMQQAGIMAGKGGNRFDPKGTATRAEVATVLRRFVEFVIDPQTAQGWVQNHSGSWQYMKNGKPATGWLQDDKKWYWLDNNGWMFTGGWKQIGGKWYYFYSDGSMAVNTTIDGYTIGPDGTRK